MFILAVQAYVDLVRQVGLAARRSDGAATGLLRADVPAVMRAVARQLKHKSAKTKVRHGAWCTCMWLLLLRRRLH
jgi:hypothetical protein